MEDNTIEPTEDLDTIEVNDDANTKGTVTTVRGLNEDWSHRVAERATTFVSHVYCLKPNDYDALKRCVTSGMALASAVTHALAFAALFTAKSNDNANNLPSPEADSGE